MIERPNARGPCERHGYVVARITLTQCIERTYGFKNMGSFVHCQLKAYLMVAFESLSQVGNKVVSVIGCNANVVHVLSTLVRFDDFVKVFFHKTRECG